MKRENYYEKIKGKYEENENFTCVYADNRIYTIAGNGDWGSVGVGEMTATGHVLDLVTYDKLEVACSKEGTFELSE